MADSKVRVRFAPSPSGRLHLGNARVAVVNKLFSILHNGELMLRVDDTNTKDQEAEEIKNNIAAISVDLGRLGIDVTDAPVHWQSKRTARYQEVAHELVKSGYVYECYLTDAEIEYARKRALANHQPPRLRARSSAVDAETIATYQKEGRKPTLRFDTSKFGDDPVAFSDLVLGQVETPMNAFGDFVVIRSDGRPSYNFASVVDDIDFSISHVIRGNDHSSNTARQMLIFKALSVDPPQFAHLSLIVKEDGSPLAKRDQATSVDAFLKAGILPMALVHYLAALGNSKFPDEPFESLAQMAEQFSWPQSSGTVHFDTGKLHFFSKRYIQSSGVEEVAALAKTLLGDSVAKDSDKLLGYINAFKDNFETIADVKNISKLWQDSTQFSDNYKLVDKYMSTAEHRKFIDAFREILTAKSDDDWQPVVQQLVDGSGLKKKQVFKGLRLLTTRDEHGPELHKVLTYLGRDELLKRVSS